MLAGAAADGAVVVEPTGGAVWTGQAGVLSFDVRIIGRPAHARLVVGRRQLPGSPG